MTSFFDAFISYGRADSKEFATKLQAHLHAQDFRVWFDFNDIPLGVDFQNQIDDGIEKAYHFLFIIAPHSVNSPYCGKEIELAIKHNKRIIPLLHVEQISRETWQQRNPNGTDDEWEIYKNKGKHTCFQNMHPTIGKINWVYFREGIDDFDKSLAGLIALLKHHDDYVENHTHLLTKALEWERNQKQTRYLLTGEEKQQAEAWLKIRFQDEQAPCFPSDLHCEYITESIKNANNLMTQVFLSYADEDRETMEKIRRSLRREGITVWTNTTDIQTGEAFAAAINRGIEQADNLVYLLSPDSVKSTFCQQELDLAVSLNKRIIPILVRETQEMQLPSVLRCLHYIDLTDNLKEDDYLVDESQLLNILYQDAAYYNEHKILLTKALKWQQQQNNPTILLRGYNLRSAETWLKLAQKRVQHPPTQLQSEFINESLRQPPLESLDVFISYSRADSDLARKLNDSLQIQGKTTWFDQESIASGSDFQQEIYQGINACDNFLFILSPRSVNSPYCKDEVEYAASLNKRFVTVLHREVNTADLHPELAKVQWIDFNGHEGDFNANFNQLVRTLDTDREHVRSHSKWLHRALEWEYKDKSDDLLLRGSEFLIAQNWLQETEEQKKKPTATSLQKAFIEASQNAIKMVEESEKRRQAQMLRLQEEKTKEAEARLAEQKKNARRQKFSLVIISIGFVAAVAFAGVAVKRTQEAEYAQKQAEYAQKQAEYAQKQAEHAQKAQLNSLSQFSLLLSQENVKFDALLEAIKAENLRKKFGIDTPKTKNLISTVLHQAVDGEGFREHNRLNKHKSTVNSIAFSPDGKTIASASDDNTIKLWNLQEGKELKTLRGHKDVVSSVAFTPDGKTIASASNDKTIKLWNLQGQLLKTLKGHTDVVSSVAFTPDGKTIASVSNDNTIKFWNLQEGKEFKTLKGKENYVNSVAFSPDGKIIAAASDDNTIKLWNLQGKELKTDFRRTVFGHRSVVNTITFSPDSKIIASASDDNTIKLWNLQGRVLKTLPSERYANKGHEDDVISVAFSPDGKTIASASRDNTIKLWNLQGQVLTTLFGHENTVNSVAFSPDGKTIASASRDNTIKIWNKQGREAKTLKRHKDAVNSVAFSPDGKTIASASRDNTIKLWNLQGQVLTTLGKGHKDVVNSVVFSPDGKTIASASRDKTIKLWNLQGQELKTLKGHEDWVSSVALSPDGKTIASASKDKTIKLWNLQGQELKTIKGHKDWVNSIAFSPDGKTIASASRDKTIKLWNLQGQETEPKTLNGHEDWVNSIAFSPDGKTIASASRDKTIKLWNLESKEPEPKTLKGHESMVLGVAFSHDGKTIASASTDKTIKFWNLENKQPKTLKRHQNYVYSVAFSPDGKTLASASEDKTVILWNLADLEFGKLMQDACAVMGGYLKHNAPTSDRDLCKNVGG
ncbi:MAG: TIR domain-containing protein [Nostocaceae cyanobacterium]|nr:TIR domain-containing protein [Nostocaceae cyanobacterium]